MSQKDQEIRRMSLVKHQMSPFSVLSVAMEILKSKTEEITVEKLFAEAGKIVVHLPELKNTLDGISLKSMKDFEKWVTGENGEGQKEDKKAVEGDLPEPTLAGDMPPKKAEAGNSASSESNLKEKNDNVIVGRIKAVSKTGKGIMINDTWYNITSKTKKDIEPEKDKEVQLGFVKGKTGFLVEYLKAA